MRYGITNIMFNDIDEDLKQTKVTKPAVLLRLVITAICMDDLHPNIVSGYFGAEFSALVTVGAFTFDVVTSQHGVSSAIE